MIVCANGIGTPRLLLLSADEKHPDGLANSSGLVGRNLMLHPNCTAIGYYEDNLESWRGPAGQLIHSMQFYDTDTSRGFVRGAKLHALPTPGPLNTIETHRQLDFDDLWGPAIHDVARAASNGILWAANVEDLPEEHNRVTLSAEEFDADGLPAPKVEYRVSENTRKILKYTVERMVELHEAAGAKQIFTQEFWVDQPGHLLGTARMGDDPATSVVDSLRPGPRCREPLHRGRQHLRHVRLRQPDLHDQRARPAGGQEGRRRRQRTEGIGMSTTSLDLHSTPKRRLSVPGRHTAPPRPLTDSELTTLLRIADCLIPASGENPAASDADEYLRYLNLALAARADVFDAVLSAVDKTAGLHGDDLRAEIKRMWAEDKFTFDPLSSILAGAYFMTPQVKALIGYPGQHRDAAGFEDAANELDTGILDPVLERGHFYVSANGE